MMLQHLKYNFFHFTVKILQLENLNEIVEYGGVKQKFEGWKAALSLSKVLRRKHMKVNRFD